jgi:hypothetical protein
MFFAVFLPRYNPNLSTCKPNPFNIRSEGGKEWLLVVSRRRLEKLNPAER